MNVWKEKMPLLPLLPKGSLPHRSPGASPPSAGSSASSMGASNSSTSSMPAAPAPVSPATFSSSSRQSFSATTKQGPEEAVPLVSPFYVKGLRMSGDVYVKASQLNLKRSLKSLQRQIPVAMTSNTWNAFSSLASLLESQRQALPDDPEAPLSRLFFLLDKRHVLCMFHVLQASGAWSTFRLFTITTQALGALRTRTGACGSRPCCPLIILVSRRIRLLRPSSAC